jgi:chromosome segregation protein
LVDHTLSRLKSLELQGYKTFANRTLFEFANTITAIVGPNGSGKSNIADSMRWVLGEQSFSLLRAKKSEDMIFSGSEMRARSGMASATMTFDNSDGWLPIDFSEVAITRRAFRDGQNEYRINGQRVRLRDVSELLGQSGLAERTYTVIGQGLVDAALSLRADERRRLFEEAAGIGLHRSRREEALRRLENTRRNLDRVKDILAELRPRLRSLERQSKRAAEYEQVRVDLRVLLREWYGFHWHHSQMDLAEARNYAQEQENNLQLVGQALNKKEEEAGELRKRLQFLRSDLNSWHRELSELHTTREAINRELAVIEERMRSYLQQQDSARNELVNSEEEIKFQQEQLNIILKDIERLENELGEARSESEKARNNLKQRQQERNKVEADVNKIRDKLSGLNSHHGKLQARLSERHTQLERTRDSLASVVKALSDTENEHQNVAEVLDSARQTQEKSRLAYQQAVEKLKNHQDKIENTESQRKDILDKRSSILAELAGLKTQLNVLEQAENSLTGYGQGAQILIKAARKKRLQGALGALSNHLQVPAELERAISSVLGEFLDAVLLGSEPKTALDLLNEQGKRGVLLPLNDIQQLQEKPKIEQSTDIVGIAADFVDVSQELRQVVDLLLGQVVIVRSRAAAYTVLQKDAKVSRTVTLQGEVFYASGPIVTSGDGNKSGDQTLLGRARQHREVQARQKSLMAEVSELDGLLEQNEKQLVALRQVKKEYIVNNNTARKELDQAETAVSRADADIQGLEKQLNWQHEQQKSMQSEIQQGEKQALEISDELTNLDEELNEVRVLLNDKSNSLSGLTLDEHQSQVSHWNTLLAVAESSLRDAQKRKAERASTLQKIEEQRENLHSRVGETVQVLQEMKEKQDALGAKQTHIQDQIKEYRDLIDPAEEELNGVEEQQIEYQKEEMAARQELSKAEHSHAQARISLAKHQEALDSLRRRIEDDFGLVAFEYVEQISGPTPLPLEGMVEQLPFIEKLSSGIEGSIKRQRAQLRRMGAINPEAQAEYQEVNERYDFLTSQMADLEKAEEDVRQVIAELENIMETEFRRTFDSVAGVFRETFVRLFGGGSARLVLTDPEDLTSSGIDIEARLPGRRTQGLALLSGGERSLTATALIFSLLKVSPTPFCVLDEVDAMLDEVNVGRFRELLRELSQNTQFVIVTHNRNTVQVADIIYGVTMGRDSVSQILSIKLDDVADVIPEK